MIKYLVIGDPIGHSRSPGMQNAAFAACGLGRPYGIKKVTAEELPDFFEFARKNYFGVNITVPHKIRAAELADSLTERAGECGSVNTLIISENSILGDSTDGVGLEMALKYCFNSTLEGKKILFCGAGGAARATAVHLAGCGVTEISFINRTIEKAQELSDLCRKKNPALVSEVIVPADDVLGCAAVGRADFLIQATSLGLKESDPMPLNASWLEKGMKVKIFDTIYHSTKLQKYAEELSLSWANGKEMLVQQGAESFRLWTKLVPPLEVMREGFDKGDDLQ